MITKHELTICSSLGISLADYVVTRRARRAGVSAHVAGSPFPAGGRGRQVVDEASERMRGTGELPSHKDKKTGAGALLAEARERCNAAYEAYRANPDSDEAWQRAAEAAAFLEEALERFAPAYANRIAPPATAYDDAESRGPGNPFEPHAAALRRRVGEAITRIADPMLRAAGGEGIAAGAMPLRPNTAELAVCSRLGITWENYLKTKKHGPFRIR